MKTVLITGAGKGFGRELLTLYARRGWVTFPLVRSHDAASELQASVDTDCHPIVADVASEHVGGEISRVLGQHCKSLDLLINNAGSIKKLRGLQNTFTDDLEGLFRVHCVGAFRCVEAALPFLERATRPVIVNVSSRWGSIARTVSGKGGGIYSYQIAKCAQNMLTACLNQELKPRGIMVFAVHPGKLQTEAAAPDADIDPGKAAIALADWVDGVDDGVGCGFHDLMGGGIIEW